MTSSTQYECDFGVSQFANLPMEIILKILTYLSPADLRSCGLVCQRFHAATQHSDFQSQLFLNLYKIHFSNDSPPISNLLNSSRDFYSVVLDQVEFGVNDSAFWTQFGDNIERLVIRSCDMRGKTFYNILRCVKNLRVLKIDQCRELFMSGCLFGQDTENCADLNFPHLTTLSITENRYLSDSIFNRIVAITPNITELDMTSCHISFHRGLYRKFYPKQQVNPSESVLTFHYISQFIVQQATYLKALNFSRTLIDGAALSTLAAIDNLVLDRLELVHCDQLTNDGIITLFTKQIHITHLNLSESSRLTDYSLIKICNCLSELKTLKLRRCRAISDAGVKEIVKLKQLTYLDISECENITDAGIVEGVAKETNEILQEMYVSALKISEAAVIKLVRSFPNLRVLDLSYCFNGVTELAMQCIFKYCRWLRILNLDHCDKITDASLTGMSMTKQLSDYENPPSPSNEVAASTSNNANGDDAPNRPHRHPIVDVLGEVLNNYEQKGARIDNSKMKISLRSKAEEEIVRDARCKQDLMKICEQNLSQSDWSGYSVATLEGLQSICLTGCNRVTDVSLLYSFRLPELRQIRLGKCQQISTAGIAELVKHCPALESVNLSECHNINDKTIEIITKGLPRLTKLFIERCYQLTDFSLDSITINCKSIREVDVRGCRSMSTEPNLRLTTVSSLRDIAMSKPGPYVTPILKSYMLPKPPPFSFSF